ncbi:hypothetical protein Ancab_001100 [Ancistrocladus abbreviatus]
MSTTISFCFLFFLFFSSLSLSSTFSSSFTSSLPQSPASACKSTLYPKLCRSILTAFGSSPSNSYNYTHFSIKQSLKQAKRLSQLLHRYLSSPASTSSPSTQKIHRRPSTSGHVEDGALADCGELFDLNVDYLGTIMSELSKAESGKASDELVGTVVSLLSGAVTNQQTCYDEIRESGSALGSALYAPLVNGGQLYSVALGLVSHALGRTRKGHKGVYDGAGAGRMMEEAHRSWERSSRMLEVLQKKGYHAWSSGRHLGERTDNAINISGMVTVSPYGDGNFTSINGAISWAPNNSKVEDGYFLIYIRQGYYQEYVVVPKHKKGIMMLGDGINRTVITGKRNVIDGWTTFQSATFVVSGERFVGINMTFQNTAGPEKHQAVAVRNNADLSTFYRCSFEGYQDTLYAHSMRQFYRECNIYGTVDFIFGNSASVFQSCNLYARKPLTNQKNAFTAQGRTDPNQNTGISIHNCTIQAAPDLEMDTNSTLNYLGRPWKEYSRTVFMQSYIGSLIDPIGWLAWNGTVGLDTIFYGEFENYGPGANTSRRVQWPGHVLMNATEALNFTVYNLTMGDTWLPYADIPFAAGLL